MGSPNLSKTIAFINTSPLLVIESKEIPKHVRDDKTRRPDHSCHAEPCAELDSALFQHLTKSMAYETLKQVQGDTSRLFTRPSFLDHFFDDPFEFIIADKAFLLDAHVFYLL
jgi:hypothetical protein